VRTPSWAGRTALGAQFWETGKAADCPIIDAHAHMGGWNGIYFPHAEPAQMVKTMERAGVRTVVFSHHAALSSPDIMNAKSVEAVRAYPGRFRAYCVYHPHYQEAAEAELAGYDSFPDVYVGLKLHGDWHNAAYTDTRYAPAWEFADKRELPVLVHSWGTSPNNGTAVMRAIAEKYPRVKLILGHSLHDQWREAVKAARDFPRVYLDLCAVLDERTGVLERFVGEVGSEKVLYGTDVPWFDFHYYIAGVVAADIAEADMRTILYRNAARLFGLGLS
jgi:predicted TIM-barrel fold metal-dependent hydrolase